MSRFSLLCCSLAHVWKLSLYIKITSWAFGSCFMFKIYEITRNKSRGQRNRVFPNADQFMLLTSKGYNNQHVGLSEEHLFMLAYLFSVCEENLNCFTFPAWRQKAAFICYWQPSVPEMHLEAGCLHDALRRPRRTVNKNPTHVHVGAVTLSLSAGQRLSGYNHIFNRLNNSRVDHLPPVCWSEEPVIKIWPLISGGGSHW